MAVAGDNQIKGIRLYLKGIRLYLFVYLILGTKPACVAEASTASTAAKAARHKSFLIALGKLS